MRVVLPYGLGICRQSTDVGCVNSGPYLLAHCGGAALKLCRRFVDVERFLRGHGIDDPEVVASLLSLSDKLLALGGDVHVQDGVRLHREAFAALRQPHGGVDHTWLL
jgi:hypothetical protein